MNSIYIVVRNIDYSPGEIVSVHASFLGALDAALAFMKERTLETWTMHHLSEPTEHIDGYALWFGNGQSVEVEAFEVEP